jgi:CheY-like chemotaxis protein
MTKPPVVALINSSPDVVDMIRITMEHAGMVLVSTMTHEVRDGEVDLEAFVRQHDPKVILYDIAPPYEANWLLFQHICSMPLMRDRQFIITTTNERQVRGLVGTDQRLFEIVGKPYDLDILAGAVKDALGT